MIYINIGLYIYKIINRRFCTHFSVSQCFIRLGTGAPPGLLKLRVVVVVLFVCLFLFCLFFVVVVLFCFCFCFVFVVFLFCSVLFCLFVCFCYCQLLRSTTKNLIGLNHL